VRLVVEQGKGRPVRCDHTVDGVALRMVRIVNRRQGLAHAGDRTVEGFVGIMEGLQCFIMPIEDRSSPSILHRHHEHDSCPNVSG
jgi:hypothetical protein